MTGMDTLIQQYGWSLLTGLGLTILCTLLGGALALVLGMIFALLRVFGGKVLSEVARLYIWFFRGTPFLIQLFIIYSGGPSIGLRLSAFDAGILTLGVYGSAYIAEIFRAGIIAVNKGQVEAASCLGLSRSTIFFRIVCPPVFLSTMPNLVNTMIGILKETVVLSIIVVPELMYQIQTLAADTFAYVTAMLCMALFYWILVIVISQAGSKFEKRLGRYR